MSSEIALPFLRNSEVGSVEDVVQSFPWARKRIGGQAIREVGVSPTTIRSHRQQLASSLCLLGVRSEADAASVVPCRL